MKPRLVLVLCFLIAGLFAQARGNGDSQKAMLEKHPPKLLHKVVPTYPPEAREKRIQGEVSLDAQIDEHGDVIEVKPHVPDKEKETVTEEPDPSLVKAAMDAVKQWKYEPYMDESGKIISVRFTVVINFKLK